MTLEHQWNVKRFLLNETAYEAVELAMQGPKSYFQSGLYFSIITNPGIP